MWPKKAPHSRTTARTRARAHAQSHTYPRKPALQLDCTDTSPATVWLAMMQPHAADDHGHMAGAAARTDRFPRHALFLLHLFVLCAAVGAVKYGETCSRDTDCEEKSAPYCKIFYTDKSFEHDERFATTDWMYAVSVLALLSDLDSVPTAVSGASSTISISNGYGQIPRITIWRLTNAESVEPMLITADYAALWDAQRTRQRTPSAQAHRRLRRVRQRLRMRR